MAEYGVKAINVLAIQESLRPPTLALGKTWCKEAVPPQVAAELQRLEASFRESDDLDPGRYTDAALKLLGDIKIPSESVSRLMDSLESAGILRADRLIVRSASLDEDTGRGYSAGVYESVICTRDAFSVASAVERVICSYFSLQAVSARRGSSVSTFAMSVFIQPYVETEVSGVSFTFSDQVAVLAEFSAEGSDAVTSGTAGDAHLQLLSCEPDRPSWEIELFEFSTRAAQTYGHALDIEWGVTGGRLIIFQIRENDNLELPDRYRPPSKFEIRRLYEQGHDKVVFGAVHGVAQHYLAKRGRAFSLANSEGLGVGTAFVIGCSEDSFDSDSSLDNFPSLFSQNSVILDVSTEIRQIILPVSGLLDALEKFVRQGFFWFVVRELIDSGAGVIVSIEDSDISVLDVSESDLLSLNRGLCSSKRVDIHTPRGQDEIDAEYADPRFSTTSLRQCIAFARVLKSEESIGISEFVLSGDKAWFVDHSGDSNTKVPIAKLGVNVISPGEASGTVLRLDDDWVLRNLSEQPIVSINSVDNTNHIEYLSTLAKLIEKIGDVIISARYPYAILALFADRVQGYIFDEGSTLGHLGIILRQRGVPGIIHSYIPETFAYIGPGGEVQFDSIQK